MKHFFKAIILFCIGLFAMSSCGDEETPTKQEEAKLEVSKRVLGFSKNAESKVVSITTNSAWYVENNSDWITVSPMDGKGDDAIIVSVSQNASDQYREYDISVAIESDSKVIVVSQSSTDTPTEDDEVYGEIGNVTIENGAIKAAFSVSATEKVYFSQGNLQYQASTNTWRFAENQYDIIGDDNKYISSSYEGWIDLFGWGTSGYNNNYPYLSSVSYPNYGVYEDKYADIAKTNYDWGVYNAIQNGGNRVGMWRTLTKDEWSYVLFDRTNASSLKASATVNGVTGMILLPDNWTTPAGITLKSKLDRFSINTYTISNWAKMEANGAVFLPTSGLRMDLDIWNKGTDGYYWSSSAYYLTYAYYLTFGSYHAEVDGDYGRYRGRSVRLVQDVK